LAGGTGKRKVVSEIRISSGIYTIMKTHQIHITGIVQGVGFRPFVYGLATRLELFGWVCNTSAGVDIEVQGLESRLQAFASALRDDKPPLARIDSLEVTEIQAVVDIHKTFEIRKSASIAGAFQPISADVALCADCERELFDPQDRRYLYPFINCTNCGPRFTIIKDIPYDRPATTMAGFTLCPNCRSEYENPLDRRFHAQPVACPECGPHVWLEQPGNGTKVEGLEAILATRRLMRDGRIVAIKGLGGFHLACDAANAAAVENLRRRKGRQGKPFALMAADMATIEMLCIVREAERNLLTGHEKPVVLLERRSPAPLAEQVAPGVDTLGVMLPYTPLHQLLLNQTDPRLAAEPVPPALVMTSGNFSEEPIATDNADALERLAPLADAFLLHNRDIHIRCDDSVVRVDRGRWTIDGDFSLAHRPEPALNAVEESIVRCPPSIVYLRRSRGYSPYPVHLPFETKPTLAVGGELKNTFCLTRDKYAFLSHHIGDMENAETYASFEQGIEHLSRLFRIQPEIIACDMHPGYFTTRWAQRSTFNLQPVAIQHHHAHIAACMADNELDNRKVIGLAFDGTGYGTDGAIWGGEILAADYAGFERAFHLEYLPLPGGDAAIRKPWRIAVGYTHALGLDISDLPFMRTLDPQAVNVVRLQVEKRLNTVSTSSMGRLFDAVAALAGIRTEVTYEAQAAIELEVLARDHIADAKPYPYQLQDNIIQLKELIAAVIESARRNEPPGLIGARFHKTIAALSVEAACRIHEQVGLNEVALSGGVWQNKLLFELTMAGLKKNGFSVYSHRQTPANDGGIALGQAVISNHIIVGNVATTS
jgi:hydrogenase maturation protein HypF